MTTVRSSVRALALLGLVVAVLGRASANERAGGLHSAGHDSEVYTNLDFDDLDSAGEVNVNPVNEVDSEAEVVELLPVDEVGRPVNAAEHEPTEQGTNHCL